LGINNERLLCLLQWERNTASFLTNWSLSDAFSLRALSGYNTGTSIPPRRQRNRRLLHPRPPTTAFSQELQFKYTTERFGLVTGVYYCEHPLHDAQSVADERRCVFRALATQDFKTDAYGVFLQANFPTDKLQLIGGLRYSYETNRQPFISQTDPGQRH
jgi:hypothetical protein